MTDRKLMQQALDALETKGEHHPRVYQAIASLRDRLAQSEQKEDWQYVQQLNAFRYPSLGLMGGDEFVSKDSIKRDIT
jgi:hypothetical protein